VQNVKKAQTRQGVGHNERGVSREERAQGGVSKFISTKFLLLAMLGRGRSKKPCGSKERGRF